jgi:hypothetical protein
MICILLHKHLNLISEILDFLSIARWRRLNDDWIDDANGCMKDYFYCIWMKVLLNSRESERAM